MKLVCLRCEVEFSPIWSICPKCGSANYFRYVENDFSFHGNINNSETTKELLYRCYILEKKIEIAKEALEFIGELPVTNAGYWKTRAIMALKDIDDK